MSGRLRVAVVSRWYPSADDPYTGSFVHDVVRALQPECDVTVLLPRAGDARDVARFVRSAPLEGNPPAVPMPRWPLSLPARAIVLDRALGRVEPDLVHVHLVLPDALPALLPARRRHVPLVVTEHVGFLAELAASRRGRFGIVQALQRADAVVVGSSRLAAEIRAFAPEARVHVIGNPVDADVFKPAADADRDLALSACVTLGEAKGTDVLLAAWARARSETELPRLVLVGGGPEVDRFRRTAERLGLGDVEFAGRRPREGLAALMRRAVFFVSPSRNERFALVVAEAIASGTPVVSTRVGGPEEYVTDEVGLLVEPGDVDGLAAAIVRIAREARAHDPAALHGYVERRFGFAAVRRQLVELYSSLLERRAPARGSRRRR